MRRVDSLEKSLMLWGIGDKRRRGRQRRIWVDGITDSMDMSLGKFWELVTDRVAWHAVIHGFAKSQIWLSDWTELNWHTIKGFRIVNKTKVEFYGIPFLSIWYTNVGNLISGSSSSTESSLSIRKFSVHVLLKPSLKNFEHYLTSMWNKRNCIKVGTFFWHCFSLGLVWKLTFSNIVAIAEFSKFAGILSAAL